MNASRVAIIALGLLAPPQVADAHVVIEGVSGFPGGLIHPLLVPAHALFLVALGLLAGQQTAAHRRAVFGVFAAASVAAILAVTLAVATNDADIMVLAGAALAGLLATTGRPLPTIVPAAIAAPAAGALMLDSVPAVVSTSETLLALAGTALGAILLSALVAWIAASPRYPWQRIGARILGAWAAASAILVLALRLAK